MKVRILSGNQAGQVTDLVGSELEFNLATGFVEPYVADPVVEAPVVNASTVPVDGESDTHVDGDNAPDHATSE